MGEIVTPEMHLATKSAHRPSVWPNCLAEKGHGGAFRATDMEALMGLGTKEKFEHWKSQIVTSNIYSKEKMDCSTRKFLLLTAHFIHQLPARGGDVLALALADVHHHVATLQNRNETLFAHRIRFVE